MKRSTKVLYWIFTILFALSMAFTAIPDVLMQPDAIVFMNHLGYPNYFIPFIGVAKLLGCIAILVPGFPRLKEWAYAGLFFDLIGAIYSNIAVVGLMPQMAGMLIWILLFVLSYTYYHKMLREKANAHLFHSQPVK